jgi:hypothetical protein
MLKPDHAVLRSDAKLAQAMTLPFNELVAALLGSASIYKGRARKMTVAVRLTFTQQQQV